MGIFCLRNFEDPHSNIKQPSISFFIEEYILMSLSCKLEKSRIPAHGPHLPVP